MILIVRLFHSLMVLLIDRSSIDIFNKIEYSRKYYPRDLIDLENHNID